MHDVKYELNRGIPKSEIRSRQGGGGKQLSYVDGFYVFDEMTRIFGSGNWGVDVKRLETVSQSEEGGKTSVSYMAVVRLDTSKEDTTTSFNETRCTMDVGYGHGKDKNPGLAHEMAGKEAVTDAVKRCTRVLGRRFGALYDSKQRHIEVEEMPSDVYESYFYAITSAKSQKELQEYASKLRDLPVTEQKDKLRTVYNERLVELQKKENK